MKEANPFYSSPEWKKLRLEALARDNYECVWCREEGKLSNKVNAVLEVDHILELDDYPEHALDLDNLRTLCKACHNKRHGRFQFREKDRKKIAFREDEWWG
ncbi:HNH endonuclease [Streptococcus sp. 121]|uniref:HNH endonuclease n=1 Tax=Streptococcus sp. 121 TaxID=2797637 RepID=UPI0018F0979B|nr:HNH endonuclease [Streptococcus sp. 121]MBJ6745215.1 HNH endonuclease [Streptococcus sp. 121]